MQRYAEKSRTPRKDFTGNATSCIGADDSERNCIAYGFPLGFRAENTKVYDDVATTLCNGTRPGWCNGVIEATSNQKECIAYSFDSLSSNSMKSSNPYSGCRKVDVAKTIDTTNPNPCKNQGGVVILEPKSVLPFDTTQITNPLNGNNPQWGDPCHPLDASAHPPSVICKCYDARGNGDGRIAPTVTGDHNNRITDYTAVLVEEKLKTVAYGVSNGQANQSFSKEQVGALNCMHDQQAVAYDVESNKEHNELEPTIVQESNNVEYIVRRLTPTECARLQGFQDEWGHPDHKDDFTDEEYRFWLNVRNEHAKINKKAVKDYTKKQMLTWYNKLHSDSSEYKMYGNGIALPCALYVMEGIAERLNDGRSI